METLDQQVMEAEQAFATFWKDVERFLRQPVRIQLSGRGGRSRPFEMMEPVVMEDALGEALKVVDRLHQIARSAAPNQWRMEERVRQHVKRTSPFLWPLLSYPDRDRERLPCLAKVVCAAEADWQRRRHRAGKLMLAA